MYEIQNTSGQNPQNDYYWIWIYFSGDYSFQYNTLKLLENYFPPNA